MQERGRHLFGLAALALAAGTIGGASGCGGGQPRAETAEQTGGEEEGGGGGESQLIPDEKYEEIKSTFDRKVTIVSRCHAQGVQSGDVERSEKGHVTVGLTINPDGSPTDVRVMESSFKSDKVGQCIVDMVQSWTFPTLPKPLETSHTYVLDRL
jgi:TonB family protein